MACRKVELGAYRTGKDKNGADYYVHRLDGDRIQAPPIPETPTGPVVERADPDTLDWAYHAILAQLPLTSRHRDDLRGRGLTDDRIDRGLYRTLPADGRWQALRGLRDRFPVTTLLAVPGVIRKQSERGKPYLTLAGKPGLLVPVRDPGGKIQGLSIRLDEVKEGTGKYHWLSSSSKKYGGPGPGAPAHCPAGIPAECPLVRLTEGAIKADVAFALDGTPTIGLAGVDNIRPALPMLEALGVKTVRLAFDADFRTNPDVQRALRSAAATLLAGGLELELELWDVDQGKGIDDLLQGGHRPRVVSGEEAKKEAGVEMAEPQPPEGDDHREEQDRRRGVMITTRENEVVAQVAAALHGDETLFVRDNLIVRPVRREDPPATTQRKLRIHYPPGATTLSPVEPAYLRCRITRQVRLRKVAGKKIVDAHPPAWLTPEVMACPGGIRPIAGLLAGPTIRPDGSLLNTPGYDPATCLFLARDLPGLVLPERPSRRDAIESQELIWRVVEQFPWAEPGDFSRWLALLLTACCRHLLDKTPLGLVNANTAGAGKSRLCELISMVVHGNDHPILMTWPEGTDLQTRGDELRKRFASLLHEGATLVLIDNLPRGTGLDSPELCALLTSASFHDRQLGRNDGRRVGGPNQALFVGTGNMVWPSGDTADRSLVVELCSPYPNPRDLPETHWRIPNLMAHVRERRAELLGAVLTIWRAWILADHPCPPGPTWGSFEEWARTIPAMIRWLDLADPIANRAKKASEMDCEQDALQSLLRNWKPVLGDKALSSGRIINAIGNAAEAGGRLAERAEAIQEAVLTLAQGKRTSWPPTPRLLSSILAAYVGRRVPGDGGSIVALDRLKNTDTKGWEYLPCGHGPEDQSPGVTGITEVLPHHPLNASTSQEDSKSSGDRAEPTEPPEPPENGGECDIPW